MDEHVDPRQAVRTQIQDKHISHKLLVDGLTSNEDELVLNLRACVPLTSVRTLVLHDAGQGWPTAPVSVPIP